MKKMRKTGRNVLYVGVLLFAVGLTGCSGNGKQEIVVNQVAMVNSNPATQEQVSRVGYGDVIKRDLYDGIVSPYVEELYFEKDGYFLEYCVSMGEEVKKGQVLARKDTEQIREKVNSLQEKVDELTKQYEYRMATLKNEEEILTIQREINYLYLEDMEYMSAKYTATCKEIGRQTGDIEYKQLEMQQLTEEYELELPYYQKLLAEAARELKGNEITAPFDGVIVQLRSMAGGTWVDAQSAYVALADTDRYIAASDYVSNNVISRAERVYAFIDGREYELEHIPMDAALYNEMTAKGQTAYANYEILTEEALEFGQPVVVVVVNRSKENVLIVPYLALQRDAAGSYCYVKRNGGREKVYVETGLYDTMNYEVLSGLAEGDEVYIE